MNGKPVCDDMWDKNDADVACRMLGYVYTIMTHFFKILLIDIHWVSQQPNQNLDLFLLSSSLTMCCVTVLRPPCLTAATMKKKIVREMRQPGLFAQVCRHI